MAQKVISVNIYIYKASSGANTVPYEAKEIVELNELLDGGWVIQDTIHSVPGNSNWANITFILEKPGEGGEFQYSIK